MRESEINIMVSSENSHPLQTKLNGINQSKLASLMQISEQEAKKILEGKHKIHPYQLAFVQSKLNR